MAKPAKNSAFFKPTLPKAIVLAGVLFAVVNLNIIAPARTKFPVKARPAQSLRDQVLHHPRFAAVLLPRTVVAVPAPTPSRPEKKTALPAATPLHKNLLAKAPVVVARPKRPHPVRLATQRVRAPKIEKIVPKQDDFSFLSVEFDAASELSSDELNLSSPLATIADAGLAESPLLEETEAATLQIDRALRVEQVLPLEPRVNQFVGVYQKEDFSQIHDRLANLNAVAKQLDQVLAAPPPQAKTDKKAVVQANAPFRKLAVSAPVAKNVPSVPFAPPTTAVARAEGKHELESKEEDEDVALVAPVTSMKAKPLAENEIVRPPVSSSRVSSSLSSGIALPAATLAKPLTTHFSLAPSTTQKRIAQDTRPVDTQRRSRNVGSSAGGGEAKAIESGSPEAPASPKAPPVVVSELPPSTIAELSKAHADGEPILSLPENSVGTLATAAMKPVLGAVAALPTLSLPTIVRPAVPAPEPTLVRPPAVPPPPPVVAHPNAAGGTAAAMVQPKSPPASKPLPTVVASSGSTISRAQVTGAGLHAPMGRAAVADDENLNEEGGVLYGKLQPDPRLLTWLEVTRGHIELYLHPVKSRDPQDTIYIEYQYPAEEFQVDLTRLHGKYRLFAGIYTPKSNLAVAQIPYPEPIGPSDYKQNLVFPLSKEALDKAANQPAGSRADETQVFTATLFEGATGNYRQPKPIAGGTLRVIGFPEWGSFTSDGDGNLRIPKVPGRSELLVEVVATGFYPTYKVIPTFSTNVYAPIYLVSRDKVDAITRYFTKSPQRGGRSLIMGRLFDPESRAPKKDETVALSSRKGHALYFGALPDPALTATTDSGLFGFFNLVPTFRAMSRPDGRGVLLNLRPDTAEYVEFGRGGRKALVGRLQDPFSSEALPPAKIQIVGDTKAQFFTDASGSFRIPDLDLPPGVLTVEVQAEGYPTTWHTVPWNTREREASRSFFILEKELLQESASSIARVKMQTDRGAVVGGADSVFFQKGAACVQVSLLDASGNPVPAQFGPFPLTGTEIPKQPLCLTRAKPGFSFYNLPAGQYLLKWLDPAGQVFRAHVVFVGVNRVSVVVD